MPLTTPFTGRRSDIGISKETTRGTTAASADYWLPYAAYSFNEKINKVRDDSGIGTIETPRGADIVKKWNEGDIEFNIRDQSIGLILLALFGTESFDTNTPESPVGRHTFTIAASNQHQSLSVWKKNPVETLQAGNTIVTSFGLRMVLDQYVRATTGLMGQLFGNDSDTVSYVSENKFRPQDVAFKLAATENELSGASAITTVRSLNLNINKNAEDYQGLGSVTPVDFVNKDFIVSGDFEIAFENDTYKDLTLLNALRAMSIKVTNSGVYAGGTTNPSLEIILDQVDFDNFEIDEANENIAILTASFTGHYSQDNSRMIRAILENSKNAAY